jgi:hypothetical protein
MTEFIVPEQLKTLAGAAATMDVCPYSRDGDQPHTFVVLAYAPGRVLQMVCQHCTLLTSFFITPSDEDEPDLAPPLGMN